VEQVVGVHAILNSDVLFEKDPVKKLTISLGISQPRAKKYFEWLRRVTVRQLTIARLDASLELDVPTLLKNPYVLTSLTLRLDKIQRPEGVSKIKDLVKLCSNIRELTIWFKPPNIFCYMICLQDICDEIHEMILGLPRLKDLDVDLDYPAYFRRSHRLDMKPDNPKTSDMKTERRAYPQLDYFKLKMLMINEDWRSDWMALLEAQNHLEVAFIYINGGLCPTELFEVAVKKSKYRVLGSKP